MSTDFLLVNKILTETYGQPRSIEFVYTETNHYAPSVLSAEDFIGRSWIGVYECLLFAWSKMTRGDLFIISVDEPPQFTPRKFYKPSMQSPPPRCSEFFAELMVKTPDEVQVPSTEGWEDLI